MMTNTTFYRPSIFSQVSTTSDATGIASIPWLNVESLISDNATETTTGLYTISGLWMQKYLTATNQLWCSGFNIPESSTDVVGVELEVRVQRAARIQDSVIQLSYGGELIGDNHAIVAPIISDVNTGNIISPIQTEDYHVYGSPTSTWGASLSPSMVADASFGIVVAFASNPTIPHRDIPYLTQVGLRITYA